ncbi:MAG: hypothetical protein V3U78_04525 [Thiotrichaceae bacterium]
MVTKIQYEEAVNAIEDMKGICPPQPHHLDYRERMDELKLQLRIIDVYEEKNHALKKEE